MCRGSERSPAFAPNPCFCSWLLRSGSWVFGLFVSCCPWFALTVQGAGSYFYSLTVSLYSVSRGAQEASVQMHCTKASQVPAGLSLFLFAGSWFGFSFSTPNFYPEKSFLKSTECWFLPLGRTPLTRSSVPLSLCLILALCSC